MKYTLLTKEQFEELHHEFATYLAANSIDAGDWKKIKALEPEKATTIMELFSEVVWEKVLEKATYLDHFSTQHIFLFFCEPTEMKSIILKANDPQVDLMSKEGLQWLQGNLFTDAVEIRLGSKKMEGDRNKAIFDLIQQGAQLSGGLFYQKIQQVIQS